MSTPHQMHQTKSAEGAAYQGLPEQVEPSGQMSQHLVPARRPGNQDQNRTHSRAVENENELNDPLHDHETAILRIRRCRCYCQELS